MTQADEIERKLTESGVHSEIAAWCAQRHAEGDSTELLQLMLLRALWSDALDPGLAAGDFPFDGGALERLLQSGASRADLDALICSAQILAVYKTCQTLDEGGAKLLSTTLGPDLAKGLGWAVVGQDPLKTPAESLGGLHSTFEQVDPRAAPNDSAS